MHAPSFLSPHRVHVSRGHVAMVAAVALVLAAAAVLTLFHDEAGPPPPGDAIAGRLALERQPYLGVSCREPNRIECGRVGLTVWLREPASRVEATVAGERARLLPTSNGKGRTFEVFIQRRGLIAALGARPDRRDGAWWGTGAPAVPVHLSAWSADGARMARSLRVRLAPGYG